MHAAQHGVLVGRQVDDAVRHDHIETARRKVKFVEALDIALQETDVTVAEGFRMKIDMPVGDFQLLCRHVHADHLTAGAHQLRQCKDIAARSAAQIEHAATCQ